MSLRLAWLAAALLAALAAALWRPGAGDGVGAALEGQLLDIRFQLRGPLPPPQGVAVLAIDDVDLETLGGFPPPRAALARAVEAATEAGAAAVALDLLLISPTPDDAALAAAFARNGRVVLAAARAETPNPALAAAAARSGFPATLGPAPTTGAALTGPTPALAAAVALGHVNVAPGVDGALRAAPAAMAVATPDGAVWLPGLALAAATRGGLGRIAFRPPDARGLGAALRVGEDWRALGPGAATPLVYYGPAGAVPTWPLRAAGEADLRGRVVFIGASALGFGDVFPSPFDPALPGVEAHATLAANLLEGRALRRDAATWAADAALALAVAGLAFAAGSRPHPWAAAGALALVAGTAAAGAQAAFLAGWWLDAPPTSPATSRRCWPSCWPNRPTPTSTAARRTRRRCSWTSPASPCAARRWGRPASPPSCARCTPRSPAPPRPSGAWWSSSPATG